MEKHFYRFSTKSKLGKEFRRLWNKCIKTEKAADIFAAKVGAVTFYPQDSVFAGGVACVAFKDNVCPKPKLWQSVGKDADGMEQWVPRKYEAKDIPADPKHPKRRLPLYVREAERIEKARVALPFVRTETILGLLKADLTNGKGDDGKLHIVRLVTPTFFEYWQHVYVGCAYPCSAEDLMEISMADYTKAERDMIAMHRDMEATGEEA